MLDDDQVFENVVPKVVSNLVKFVKGLEVGAILYLSKVKIFDEHFECLWLHPLGQNQFQHFKLIVTPVVISSLIFYI